MRGVYLSLAAVVGSASAWQYPSCVGIPESHPRWRQKLEELRRLTRDQEPDNCYRELVDPRFTAEANTFCPQYLAGTTTAPSAIPTDFSNCGTGADGVSALSSACSCVTYSLSSSSSTPTSTSASAPLSTTSPSSHSPPPTSKYSKPPKYTTSTIYTTTVYTVTSCAPTVTNCPGKGHVTTETIAVTTTVCPVTESESAAPSSVSVESTTPCPTLTTSIGTAAPPPSKTSSSAQLVVTAAAGRVVFDVVAAAAGVVAVALL